MERGKAIGSVNILDLRKATEESLREYEEIRSVNMALYTSETAHLLRKLKIGSVNSAVEVPADVKVELIMGPLKIGAKHFSELAAPLGLLVIGPVTISPDLKPEDLDRGLAIGMVMGPITCPEPLVAIVQSKLQLVMGPVQSYPVFEKVYMGSLALDDAYLRGLDDRTELVVVGSLKVAEKLPSDLIRRKIAKLHVTGLTTCFDGNAAILRSVLTGTSGRVRTIPDGFKVIEKEIRLTRDLLTSITERKLYFTQDVVIDAEVDESLFAAKIESISSEGTVFCPQPLRSALSKVCDLLDTRAVFYEGELWMIDGETELHPSRFDYLDGKATVVVTGVLTVSESVAPDVLASRLATVYLYGVIECSPEQQAAIESRIGVSEGVFDNPGLESERPEYALRSANYLVL